tara:strand:+ start:1129 stop:1254 length:126 start_codon:yes stop_codon:yes gene_type:complete
MSEGVISIIATLVIIAAISAVFTITFYFALMLKEMIEHARR